MQRGGVPMKLRHLKLLDGKTDPHRIQSEPHVVDLPIVKPDYLSGRAAVLWDEVLVWADWLTVADTGKLAMWCLRQTQMEDPKCKWKTGDYREHRALGCEMGFDPGSRARLSGGRLRDSEKKREDPSSTYFRARKSA